MTEVNNQKDITVLLIKLHTMIANKEFDAIKKYMRKTDLSKCDNVLVVGNIRGLYVARNNFQDEYDEFVIKAIDTLDARGVDSTKLLKGII